VTLPTPDNQPSIGEEGRAIRERNRRLRNQIDVSNTKVVAQAGGVANAGDTALWANEHYHLCFEIVGTGEVMPFFQMAYPTPRSAYLEVKRLGDESEPNTEWGQDGRVLIEAPIAGRSGLFRIIVSVARCVAKRCSRKKKSKLILPYGRN
jgi:hypothetical protein